MGLNFLSYFGVTNNQMFTVHVQADQGLGFFFFFFFFGYLYVDICIWHEITFSCVAHPVSISNITLQTLEAEYRFTSVVMRST